MEIALFKISSYLRPGEATHVARKELADRWPAAAHRHDYFEVFLIEKGATEHWINGQREILSKGHVVFIRPDDAHAFCANPEEGCGIVNVMVRADTATHLKQRYPEEFRGRFFDNPARGPDTYFLQGPRMERAINVAQDLANSKLTLARVEEFLLTLANRVIDPVHRLNSAAPRWLIDACAAARSPEVFRAGAAGFVAAAGRSHEHVCRTCRDVLGISPSTYINRLRIEHAADLLARTTIAIPDIVADCGIENTSHFYRLFGSHYGTTPRGYRLRHQRNPFETGT